MGRHINSISELREYVQGVLRRITHHAPDFAGVASSLLAAVVSSSDSLECRQYGGKPGNVLRFTARGRRYALRFRHNPDRVDLVEGHERGKQVVASFDATSTPAQVMDAFGRLPGKLLRLRLLSSVAACFPEPAGK